MFKQYQDYATYNGYLSLLNVPSFKVSDDMVALRLVVGVVFEYERQVKHDETYRSSLFKYFERIQR